MIGSYLRRLRNSHVGWQFVNTAFWSLVGEAFARGLMLLALVFVAHMLGPAIYGELGLVRTTMLMVASFGGLGLGMMANRYVAQYRGSDPQFSGQIIGASYLIALVSGLLLGGGVAAFASLVARQILHAPQLTECLQLAGLVLFCLSLNGAQVGIMQGLHAYRNLAAGNFVQGVIAFVCLVAGAHLGGLVGAMIGIVIHSAASAVLFHLLIMREVRRQDLVVEAFEFRRILPILWAFSLPMTLTGIAVAPFKWISETLLARDVGFAHLGTFHAAMVIINGIIGVASTINAPLISVTARLQNAPHGGKVQFVNLYGSWYAFLALALPIVIFPDVVALAFSVEFRTPEFRAALLLLIVYCGLLMYHGGMVRIFMISGSLWVAFLTNVVEGLVLFAGFSLLASHGVVGLGIAYVLSYVARISLSIPFLLRSKLVTARLMFDRYFLLSLAVLLLLVVVQYRSTP